MRMRLVLVSTLISAACGASVSQKYESDVRFERCLALDWQETVDPNIRHRCWEEWVEYYADGQNKDRIEYARTQMADIEGRKEGRAAADRAPSLPEPKSVFEPVPMMASATAGSASAAPSASAPSVGKDRPPCESKCDRNLEGCLSGCKVAVCEQFCAQKHGRCAEGCVKSRNN
ncbi:MAG: hypothetical protein JNL21_20425 [Myxococcales bacterium]|nr:hypothetical protein [Myxococcales bacterium]